MSRISTITYPVVWVGELLRVAVKGFKVKGFSLVEGNHFGKRSSMILTEHLALSETQNSPKKKGKVRKCKVITGSGHCVLELARLFGGAKTGNIHTYSALHNFGTVT